MVKAVGSVCMRVVGRQLEGRQGLREGTQAGESNGVERFEGSEGRESKERCERSSRQNPKCQTKQH